MRICVWCLEEATFTGSLREIWRGRHQKGQEGAQRAWRDIFANAPSLLDIALDHLTLTRVELYHVILFNSPLPACEPLLAKAVNGLRESGNMDDLPRGLLTRAWARFAAGDEKACRDALDEAWEIAERGSMNLHMADIHLYRARFFKDRTALKAAADLIEETAYHRRDEELADLQKAAKAWPPN